MFNLHRIHLQDIYFVKKQVSCDTLSRPLEPLYICSCADSCWADVLRGKLHEFCSTHKTVIFLSSCTYQFICNIFVFDSNLGIWTMQFEPNALQCSWPHWWTGFCATLYWSLWLQRARPQSIYSILLLDSVYTNLAFDGLVTDSLVQL